MVIQFSAFPYRLLWSTDVSSSLFVSYPCGNFFCIKLLFLRFWYFVTKIVPTVRKNCSSDREKLWKFVAEGRDFAKILRLLEQFIQTVKGQNAFLTCSWRFLTCKKLEQL